MVSTANFFSVLVVQLLAELADGNFAVIVFLSSWGPFWGMREHTRTSEAALVVVGVATGFILRVVLASIAGLSPTSAYLYITKCLPAVVLWFLVARATSHYRNADHLAELDKQRKLLLEEDKAKPPAQEEGMAEGSEDQSHKKEHQQSLEQEREANGGFQADDLREPMFLAFFVPLVTALTISTADPVKGVLVSEDGFGFANGVAFALCLGSILSAIIAVVGGTVLETQLSDRRFLLAAAVTMGMSALAATGNAVLFFAQQATPSNQVIA